MNINELEKHIKFDLIFTLLIFIGVGLCFLLSIVFLFKPTSVKAKEISNNVNISAKAYMPCGSTQLNGKYCAYTMDPTYTVRSTNTTYNGVLNGITFQFSDMINTHSQYTMTIEAMSTDFRNNNLQVDVMASNQSDQLGTQITTYSWSYVSKSKIQIIFMQDSYYYHTVVLTGYPLTGVSTYGIKKVTMTYDDGINDNSDIINSNTQNTNDIISNNNSNTTDIINNQNSNTESTNQTIWDTAHDIISQFTNACTNKLDMSKVTLDTGVTATDVSAVYGSITITGTNGKGFWTDYIPVDNSLDYYFNAYHKDNHGFIYWAYFYDKDKVEISNYRTYGGKICQNQSACIPLKTKYIRMHVYLYLDGTTGWSNLRFMTTNGGFCQYGTTTGNKLDQLDTDFWEMIDKQEETIQLEEEQRDIAQDQYDWLSDNSNPTVDSNGIQNTINSVQTTNPLSYLLTLPTNLLSAILDGLNTNTCTDFEIGKFGHVGRHDLGTYTFKFPCIDIQEKLGNSLYNTIDIFVAIGIIALTIVKLYNTISSYISLGAEDEVKSHSHFLTPMDFLGNILGGNISGVGSSLNNGGTL